MSVFDVATLLWDLLKMQHLKCRMFLVASYEEEAVEDHAWKKRLSDENPEICSSTLTKQNRIELLHYIVLSLIYVLYITN